MPKPLYKGSKESESLPKRQSTSMVPVQFISPLVDQGTQTALRHAIYQLIHTADKAMASTITTVLALRALLHELAVHVMDARAGHVPSQDP